MQTIDNNTLAALTLLIAESNPKEKEVIIDLVMNFFNNEWDLISKWEIIIQEWESDKIWQCGTYTIKEAKQYKI